ncbi:MAG: peptidoglycan editing factor PgeF [Cyanobacteria bacterium]|nr:peptidoglycan editing factor PgeF [Cyanobacteriota bacterium]
MILPRPDATFHWTSETWGNALRSVPLGAAAQHLFTSRQLPLPDAGAWRAALESIGSTPDRLMRVKQVHGNVVRVLERGRVPADAHTQRPDGDAIVSNEPGLALAVMVADCVPILLCDPVTGAAAAIHAGWRGTCARVAPTAIEAMQRDFGTTPSNLIAAIGPSVGPADYQVGEALVTAFLDAGHPQSHVDRWFDRRGGTLFLDLWAANTQQLIDAGVDSRKISMCGLSTVSRPDIFDSYRVEGERAGRMAGIIVVPTSAKATVGKPS